MKTVCAATAFCSWGNDINYSWNRQYYMGSGNHFILVTGGARSGKSTYAQQRALQLSANPVYVATAKNWGGDFDRRIKRHQQNRDERWTNHEELIYVSKLPLEDKVVLIDCVTLWLTNIFIKNKNDADHSLEDFKSEIDSITQMNGAFIVVTNEIGMGVHAETEIARHFTDLQGWANQYVASKANEVIFMVSGIAVKIKG
jgi:adenosylcobinamide kinase/adenosylcobinamide-phosphate guanylyltransferase